APVWSVTIPSRLKDFGATERCLDADPFAHCGRASGVSAPSIIEHGGRAYLAIGIGARLYVGVVSGHSDEPAPSFSVGRISNLNRSRGDHFISASPGYGNGRLAVGGWQGVFGAWDMA